MEKLKILFGFSDNDYEAAVKALLRSKGYDAQISARFSKESVKAFIEKNPDTDAMVILEAFPKSKESTKSQKYTAEEVAQLADNSDVNIILVLSENYKGTDYMRTLFAAGITSAFFQRRGNGARPRDIAALILQKRTRKSAREYYGIGSQTIELGFLDNDVFNKLYTDLKSVSSDSNMLENYLAICAKLSPQQIADFTRRLPGDDRDYLAQFEEFHTVLQLLKKFGIDMKIKRPKRVSVGLKSSVGISMKDDRMVINKNAEPMPVEGKPDGKTGKPSKQKREKSVKDSLKAEESSVSMSELFSCLDDVDDEDLDDVCDEGDEDFTDDVIFSAPEEEVVKESVVKEEPKTEVVEDEEEEPEAVVFDEVDASYDELMLESGGKRFSLPFIIVIVLFVAIIITVCVFGGNNGASLF